LVWNANPDRGLPVAAVIFQEIRKRWPEMTLHVYGRFAVYGWGEEHERLLLPEDKYMEGVTLHQPVARLQLARILMRSWAYFYPTFWPETYCCATLEAQAAGTPVITSPVGALPETVKGGIVTQDIINAVSQLRNVRKWRKCSEAGLEYAKTRDWSLVAQRWEEGILQ
jgi:glycosyltransferase involved in cell wall biosynthesis